MARSNRFRWAFLAKCPSSLPFSPFLLVFSLSLLPSSPLNGPSSFSSFKTSSPNTLPKLPIISLLSSQSPKDSLLPNLFTSKTNSSTKTFFQLFSFSPLVWPSNSPKSPPISPLRSPSNNFCSSLLSLRFLSSWTPCEFFALSTLNDAIRSLTRTLIDWFTHFCRCFKSLRAFVSMIPSVSSLNPESSRCF